MKEFRFTLQSILKLYEDREESAQRQYARTLAELEAARKLVEAAQGELHLCRQGVLNATTSGCQAWRVEQVRLYAQVLLERLDKLEIQRRDVAVRVQNALRALLALRQKRETLDKLRGRRSEEYNAAVLRADQKQIDELIGATYGRPNLFATRVAFLS